MNSGIDSSLQELQSIRQLMERSSRFMGLSGLSGIGAGCFALLGAGLAFLYLEVGAIEPPYRVYASHPWGITLVQFFVLDSLLVLAGALSCGIYFTSRRSLQKGQPIWDALTKRLLLNLFIPLVAGGVFCIALLYHRLGSLIAPTTLVFYGLALLNASKYTLPDVRQLGLAELLLGLLALFLPGRGLLFWTIGFGLLHIFYGSYMYWKYEAPQATAPFTTNTRNR